LNEDGTKHYHQARGSSAEKVVHQRTQQQQLKLLHLKFDRITELLTEVIQQNKEQNE
jgi:hypothetical protein